MVILFSTQNRNRDTYHSSKRPNTVHKNHQAKILKAFDESKCRMCREVDETVSHIAASCQKLAGTEYPRRHGSVAATVHLESVNSTGSPPQNDYHGYKNQRLLQKQNT